MRASGSMLAAAGAGAGLAFLFDPANGPRRRALVRDKVVHTAAVTRRVADTTTRDALQRTYGSAVALGRLVRRERVDDDVLVERVRAKLGRWVSHPRAIDVVAADGVITLQGHVLTSEADALIRAVRRVRGVSGVLDNLQRHYHRGSEPSLQGGIAPAGDRFDLFQDNWSPTTRCVVGTTGLMLFVAGMLRRDQSGVVAQAIGLAAIGRAVTNVPMRRLLDVGADAARVNTRIQPTRDAARLDWR